MCNIAGHNYCFLNIRHEESRPQVLVHIRDILTEVSPEKKDGTEVFTTVASHFWINVAGLPMSAQEIMKPQSALAGAIPKGIGSSTTPLGLS